MATQKNPSEAPPKKRGRKQADGAGSLYFDQKAGLWVGEVMVGYKPNGRPDRRRVKAKRQAECQRKLDEVRASAGAGTLREIGSGRESVGTFLLRWLEGIEGTRRESTLYRYEVNVKKHLIPAIGRYRLPDLKPEHLVKLYAESRRAGFSPRTVRYQHTTIRLALDTAVKWNAVAKNVARAVDAPRVPRVEVIAPSPTEVAILLESATAHADPLLSLWTVAVHSGARSGELLSLTWEDVDFKRGSIAIRRTLAKCHGGVPTFNEPKTANPDYSPGG
jgi:integrase